MLIYSLLIQTNMNIIWELEHETFFNRTTYSLVLHLFQRNWSFPLMVFAISPFTFTFHFHRAIQYILNFYNAALILNIGHLQFLFCFVVARLRIAQFHKTHLIRAIS